RRVELANLVGIRLGEPEVAVEPDCDALGQAAGRGDGELVDRHRQQAPRLHHLELEPTRPRAPDAPAAESAALHGRLLHEGRSPGGRGEPRAEAVLNQDVIVGWQWIGSPGPFVQPRAWAKAAPSPAG